MFRFALAVTLAATPAFAQEGPSFDCTKAESSAEKLVCSDAALATLDRRVNARFLEAIELAKKENNGQGTAEQDLRAEQRGWIKGRDECWKAEDQRACVENAYLTREGQLVADFMLQEPTAVVTWQCEGNPSNEVVTFFFDTELPSVRFERGDQVDTGSVLRTGSGSKYEGSFGRSIWIKGNEATYREPDPDGSELHCVTTD